MASCIDFKSQVGLLVSAHSRPTEKSFRERCIPGMGCMKSNKLELVIEEPQGLNWWIGVRAGTKDEYFLLSVDMPQGLCADSCSKRGVCIGRRCSCNVGSSGSKCQQMQNSKATHLAVYANVAGSIVQNGWRYYFMNNLQQYKAVRIIMKILSFASHVQKSFGDNNVHLVVNKSDHPKSITNNQPGTLQKSCSIKKQKINEASELECTVTIENPGSFGWWLGVFGNGIGGHFNLETYGIKDCPKDCRGNGVCHAESGQCFCNSKYYGKDCLNMDQTLPIPVKASKSNELKEPRSIALSEYTQGFKIDENSVNYHKINLPVGNGGDLKIHVEQIDNDNELGENPLFLYLRRGAIPSQNSHLIQKEVSKGEMVTMSISTTSKTKSQIFWLAVQTAQSTMYRIHSEISDSECKNGCSGQGLCHHGACQCLSSFAGFQCEYSIQTSTISDLVQSVGQNVIVHPYKWVALQIDKAFGKYNAKSKVDFYVDVHKSLQVFEQEGAESIESLCEELNVVVYGGNQTKFLSPLAGGSRDSCRFSALLDSDSQGISRMEALWLHDETKMKMSKNNLTFTYDYDFECPNKCSNAGDCKRGVCVCNHDRAGFDCSQLKPQLLDLEEDIPFEINHEKPVVTAAVEPVKVEDTIKDLDMSQKLDYQYLNSKDMPSMSNGYGAIAAMFLLILILTVIVFNMRSKSTFSLTSFEILQVYMRLSNKDDDFIKNSKSSHNGGMREQAYKRPGLSRSYTVLPSPIDEEIPLAEDGSNGYDGNFTKTGISQMELPLPVVCQGNTNRMRHRRVMSWGVLSTEEQQPTALRRVASTEKTADVANHIALTIEK